MEKNKPGRNWRVLLTEIGIIVLGVSIALGAEQAVSKLNDNRRAATARDAIHSEIARNLGYMNARNEAEACAAKRLDEVDGLIAASAAGKLPQDPIWLGLPVGLLMHDGKYKAALQSGSISLLPSREQGIYADVYVLFDTYGKMVIEEYAAWADLRVLEKHPLPSPVLDWELRSAVQQARSVRWGIQLIRSVIIRDAAEIGVKPHQVEKILSTACTPLHTARAEALKATKTNMTQGFDHP